MRDSDLSVTERRLAVVLVTAVLLGAWGLVFVAVWWVLSWLG